MFPQRAFPVLIATLLLAAPVDAQIQRMGLVLPTDNQAIFEGQPQDFFQFVDRTVDGVATTPWEGGQFGFVRDPHKLRTGQVIYGRFHEGLDIKPVHRDAGQEPRDEVRSMSGGEVVHCATEPGKSNYGRYVVVKHEWGYGPFYSLYAHLREIRVTPGQKVEPGTVLGIMGYSGTGIDRRRAHTHVEMNLFLSSRFQQWHDANFKSPNHHGLYNGLNLIGLDLSGLLKAHQKDPSITAASFVTHTEPGYRVLVPGTSEMELLKHYPWLCDTPLTGDRPASWEITFSPWGLPVTVRPSAQKAAMPTVTWVKDLGVPHYYPTRGILTGSGSTAKITSEGLRFLQLVTGAF